MGCAGPIICIFQTVLKIYISISCYISTNNSIHRKGFDKGRLLSLKVPAFLGSDFSPSKANETAGCLSFCDWCQAVRACANMLVLLFL
jgi:hypothetical protein